MAQVKDVRRIPVTIELGGKKRTIKYDLNAFAELELRFGSVQKAMESLETGSMKSVRTVLWAGLIHEEAIIDEILGEPTGYKITPFDVGGWVEPSMMQEISNKIAQAVQGDLPEVAAATAPINTTVAKEGEVIEMAKVVLTPEEEAQAKAEEEKNA
jgi:hypothetical protein